MTQRSNLAGACIAMFSSVFAYSFVAPFVPVFLNRDFGIQDQSQLPCGPASSPAALA